MINAEKLLGGLLGGSGALGKLGALGGLGSTGRGGLPTKAAMGMGLLGVAMAAFEHFTENRTQSGATPPPSIPGSGPGGPMVLPPSGPSAPPPAPGAFGGPPSAPSGPPAPPSGAPPAPPPPPASPVQADPVLLIRAMIASANADGLLDDTERSRILGQLEGVGLSEEEKDFLCAEFDAPKSLADIAAGASSPTVAAQVFTVSLLAVDVDTPAERDYLDGLRQALGLSPEQARAIARRLGRSCA